jgi:aryl-alcohol dehydrogenase-like predicted oxidoreductase
MSMKKRPFGKLGEISCLTLGGGGIGQVWGSTSREEAVATVREAVANGVTFLDLAPAYGKGEAELVIGTAFGGHLPDGVRISTKCMLGNPHRDEVQARLERSLDRSLSRMKLGKVDLFLLHGQIVPDTSGGRAQGTPYSLFIEVVRPTLERLVAQGRIGAWGIYGIGVPTAILDVINTNPPPAAVQAVANLLDSIGGMKFFDGPARPRDIIEGANRRGIAVMGIRAVQAGALTDALDRELPENHPEMLDFQRAASFRALAK